MTQRIFDFLISQSVRSKDLSVAARFFRLFIFLIVLAIPTLLCGFLVNFKVAFQMWLFLLAGIVPLVGGFFLIGKYLWKNQKTAFLWATGLLGFVAAELSVIGMLIDERSINVSFSFILLQAVLVGIATFILTTIGTLFYTALIRAWNGKR
jgi:FtsH-binding integral membrane protein